ncbi:MAG: hypothetical protein AAF492_30435 [Verrucomicrobiota bacterium]
MKQSYETVLDARFGTICEKIQMESGVLDLATRWRMLLNAPLSRAPDKSNPGARSSTIPPATLDDLFHGPEPPPELLLQLKDFAKLQAGRPDGLLPKELCTALYFICIRLAVQSGETISELDDHSVKKGVQWVLAQSWVDEGTKELLQQSV